MQLDVVFSPGGFHPADMQGRTIFVVDILRATTTICAALHHGARSAIPVGGTDDALRLAQTIGSGDVLLAGERECVRIPGFQLGNSPLEMTAAAVRGKTLIVTTTNGTQALLACPGAAAVYLAAAVNLSAAAARARDELEHDRGLVILCAGRSGGFSLDDAYCAGRLIAAVLGDRKPRRGLSDAAIASLDLVRRYGDRWERPLRYSRAGRELVRLGFAADVAEAGRLDAYPVLPYFHERRVTLAPEPS
ncbi:MAG: 2-phosphosulfolactate phosphatase [Gemmatimonadales bacterium]|nr:2-phosphosulfolactate phosphatase [Gemmatimonadales bacterium]